MNINQQAEIEILFKRINKGYMKNNSSNISEDDLNKVRAYVVQSQRPLQAVRLLSKEREGRDTNDNFLQQKEDIIKRARDLDEQRTQYKEEQQNMIDDVTDKTKILQQNSLKRKNEEDKLNRERAAIEARNSEIKKLNEVLKKKKEELKVQESNVKRHRIFQNFLDSVVAQKRGDQETFIDIGDLQDRFKNLKEENRKLINNQKETSEHLDDTRLKEIQKLREMRILLHSEKSHMTRLQSELEGVQEKQTMLEHNFENEINSKNKNNQEIGQLIGSINNIFTVCRLQQAKRGKKLDKQDIKIKESDQDLVEQLTLKVERCGQTVNELVKVNSACGGKDYMQDGYTHEEETGGKKEESKHQKFLEDDDDYSDDE